MRVQTSVTMATECAADRWRRPFRISDKGGTRARTRLEPQDTWEVNDPDELASVLSTPDGVQQAFTDRSGTVTNDFFAHLLELCTTWLP